jgi:hypothetical protein
MLTRRYDALAAVWLNASPVAAGHRSSLQPKFVSILRLREVPA